MNLKPIMNLAIRSPLPNFYGVKPKYSRTAAGPLLVAFRMEVAIFVLIELLTDASFPVSRPWRDAET